MCHCDIPMPLQRLCCSKRLRSPHSPLLMQMHGQHPPGRKSRPLRAVRKLCRPPVDMWLTWLGNWLISSRHRGHKLVTALLASFFKFVWEHICAEAYYLFRFAVWFKISRLEGWVVWIASAIYLRAWLITTTWNTLWYQLFVFRVWYYITYVVSWVVCVHVRDCMFGIEMKCLNT